MIPREAKALFKESGFMYLRPSKHGELWTDGISIICAGNALSKDSHNIRNLEAEIKRSIKKRPGFAIEASPKATDPYRRIKEQLIADPELKKPKSEALQDFLASGEVGIEIVIEKKPLKEVIEVEPVMEEAPVRDLAHTTSESEEVKAKRRWFKDEDRVLVWTRILELQQADLTVDQIVEVMRDEEWTMSDGSEFERDYAATVLNGIKSGKITLTGELAKIATKPNQPVTFKSPGPPVLAVVPPLALPSPVIAAPPEEKPAPPEAPALPSKLPSYVIGILMDESLSDRQKVAMIKIYADL